MFDSFTYNKYLYKRYRLYIECNNMIKILNDNGFAEILLFIAKAMLCRISFVLQNLSAEKKKKKENTSRSKI